MTKEDRLLLNALKQNTQHLFRLYNNLEQKKKLLQEQIATLHKEINKLEQERLEIGRKNEQLKIANQLLSGNEDNREAKQKINSLIREIDKCIALLNK